MRRAANGIRIGRYRCRVCVVVAVLPVAVRVVLVVNRLAGDEGTSRASVILISTQDESDFAELINEAPALGFVSKSELSAATIERLVDSA